MSKISHLVIFILLITNCPSSFGQDTTQKHFPQVEVSWRGYGIAHDITIYDHWDFLYVQRGDTILDSVSYKKLYKNSYGDNLNLSFIGGLRYDSITRKVFFYNSMPFLAESPDSVEYLLYDFSLGVGQKLKGFYSNHSGQEVTDIDTVIINGKSHRRLHFSSLKSIIEGIGGEGDLLFGVCGLPGCSWLNCVVIDSNVYYPSDTSVCDLKVYNLIKVPTEKEKKFEILPNPNNGRFKISLAMDESLTYSVLNLTGKELHTDQLKAGETLVQLPYYIGKGMFLFKYRTAQTSGTIKFMVE